MVRTLKQTINKRLKQKLLTAANTSRLSCLQSILFSAHHSNTGKTILVPGHVRIGGNERADDVAKMAFHCSIFAVKYPPSDLYHVVTSLCYEL